MTFKKMKRSIIILSAFCALIACDKPQTTANSGAMPPMPVSVITVKPTTVPMSIEAVGQTEGAKQVEIRPRVGGILLKKLFEEGAKIKAGQPMFLIDPAPFQIALSQARAQLEQQNSRVAQTKREAERLQALVATQSISQREADNAQSDYALAMATLLQYEANVREAQLNLSYTRVTSPIAGMAGRSEFSEGSLVTANTTLLTDVSQASPIWVRFSLSDSEFAAIGGRMSEGNVKEVVILQEDGKPYPVKGQINFASSMIDPQLGTQQLRATFQNDAKTFLPGQFVKVRVTTGEQNGVFLVPQTAVLTNDLGKSVFVANEKNEAIIKPITVGNWVDKDWVVLSGLNDGDRVIVDNLIKLRPNAPVAPHPFGLPPTMPAKPM